MFTKLKSLKNRQADQGFTIIEVMIVLAIAGLILLIVLLAVPAVQRNSRNTTIKSAVGDIAGAISTFESDNNGTTPSYVNDTTSGALTVENGSTPVAPAGPCVAPSGSGNPTENANTPGGLTVNCGIASPGGTVPASTIDVEIGVVCPSPVPATGPPGNSTASNRSVAIYYAIETSGGTTNECSSS
jgi:prepilin-type N-terminal cleavage/methylation domain-containing protein